MLRKESISKHTGLVAHYSDGSKILEKENYFSQIQKRKCATNWADIDKKKLSALELLWRGKSIVKISLKEYPFIKPDDWYFTHSAFYDMKQKKITIVSRNIGYNKDEYIQIYSVEESTGRLKIHSRKK